MREFVPWTIVHLDLSLPIPPLEQRPGTGGIYLVAWLGDLPLGHLEIPAAELPLPAGALEYRIAKEIAPAVGDRLLPHGFAGTLPVPAERAASEPSPSLDDVVRLEDPLRRLSAALATGDGGDEAVSVVICTRGRPDDLRRALRSVFRCDPRPDEVVIVDNEPSDPRTRGVVGEFAGVRYVAEPRPGLSVARNSGVRDSTGALVAFTDDDVEVHPRWIAAIRGAFQGDDVLAVTGLVLPAELRTPAQWAFEKVFGGFGQGYRALVFDADFFNAMSAVGVPVWRIGAGANMAFRRAAFAQVGLFDERLGAGAAGCSEDSELWYRLLARGWRCRYDPSAVVFHHHRREVDALQRQMHHYMRGHVAALLVQHALHGHRGNLYRLLVTLPTHYARQTLRTVARRRVAPVRTIGLEIRGCFEGTAFYFRHRRHPAVAADVDGS